MRQTAHYGAEADVLSGLHLRLGAHKGGAATAAGARRKPVTAPAHNAGPVDLDALPSAVIEVKLVNGWTCTRG